MIERKMLVLKSTHKQKHCRKHPKICYRIPTVDKDNRTESIQNLQDKIELNKILFPGAKITVSDYQFEIKPELEDSCLNKEHTASQPLQLLATLCEGE